jgi:hypothetical protein
MSDEQFIVAVYRRAIRLYPKRFREEYRDDLVALLADQLRDEPAVVRQLARGRGDRDEGSHQRCTREQQLPPMRCER